MAKTPAYPLEESIGFLISSTHRVLRPLLEARVSGSGVSYGMWFFLRVLWEEDGISQREVAARVGIAPPTAVAALRKLEAEGMIELRADRADGRRMQIYLTPKGRALEKALLPKVEQINKVALRGLSKADFKNLRRILSAIQSNVVEP